MEFIRHPSTNPRTALQMLINKGVSSHSSILTTDKSSVKYLNPRVERRNSTAGTRVSRHSSSEFQRGSDSGIPWSRNRGRDLSSLPSFSSAAAQRSRLSGEEKAALLFFARSMQSCARKIESVGLVIFLIYGNIFI